MRLNHQDISNKNILQTISVKENDPIIDDDMEIIPSNNDLHDDFVRLDYHDGDQHQVSIQIHKNESLTS
jgi:hypothetical protein